MSSRSLGHRAPLLWLVAPYLAGLAAGRLGAGAPPAAVLASALAAALLAVASAWRQSRLWAPALIAALFLAGWATFSRLRGSAGAGDAVPPREARLDLRLVRTFPSPFPHRATGTAIIAGTEPHLAALAGQRVYFSLGLPRGAAAPVRSAVVGATGVLSQVSRSPPAGSSEERLADLGIRWRLTRGRLRRIERPESAYCHFCERLAKSMRSLLGAGLEGRPDVAGVYRAMMLGQKQDLTAGQRALFLRSGTMHLFAINGLHIGVVALSLHALLAILRCPRPLASVLVLAVLWLDVDTTGGSPSAVRAFLMVAVLEAPSALRLPGNPIAAMAAAALGATLVHPADFLSPSFQMSYGVVAVILTLGLPLAEWLSTRFPAYPGLPAAALDRRRRLLAAAWRHFLGGLGVGCAAALVGAITGVEFFGVLTPGGLPANLVLAPLAALVIVSGFLSITAGLAGASVISRFLNGAASLLLRAILGLIHLGLQVPHLWFNAHFRAPWIGPAALSALLAACLAGYAGNWKGARGGFWPPFALAALTLVFGVKFGLNASP